MQRRYWLALSAFWAAAPLAMAAGTNTPPMSADQIVQKNVAARGGAAAWRAVSAISYSGQIDAGGKQNTRLPFTMTLQRPHKSRLEIRFQDKTAVQVYDGQNGWKLRPFLNRDDVDPYTAAELKQAADWDELDGPLVDHARKGTRVEVAGTESVEGKSAYKLKLTARDGTQRHLWIDAKSFLELRIDGAPRKLDAKVRKVYVYYRDFRPEGGLTVPHELETTVEGVRSSHKMTFQTVKLNPPVDPSTFAKPGPSLAAVASK